MAHTTRIGGALGLAAALAMAAPASAAQLPLAPTSAPATGSSLALIEGLSTSTYNPAAETAEWRRCGWRGCWRRGWRGGWRGGWGRRRGIGVGDVVAGAVIIGGIAAIASAANNNRRRDREVVVVERDRRIDDDRRFDDRRVNPRASGASGLDGAVSQCLREIERDVRVENVDGASRIPSGWVVTGTIFDGSGFSCEIGNDGRIDDISFGGYRSGNRDGARSVDPINGRADGQWSDDIYSNARAALGREDTPDAGTRFADAGSAVRERPAQPLVPLTSDRMPAYPGGPVPGEEY
jgi:hypothetical protein